MNLILSFFFFFFFKQKTAYEITTGDWSSDVCSSDLTELRGRVLRLMDKGVVVDLGHDIEGFVPMSQPGIPDLQNPADAVKEGQAAELKVLEVDPIHHRIVLAATGWPKENGAPEAARQDTQG